jgi:hypothetical protein|tara:strand:+ start:78 stop:1262 length:1185 start_codon:yes stop_codon:yes gene_type:complete
MKKESGLRDEKKVGRILVSGSTVLPEKNSAGIRIVRKSKVTKQSPIVKGYPDLSDVPTDSYGNLSEAGILTNDKIDGGIISGKLIRPNYDRDELEKSIDTNIFELIPNTPVQLPDTVLRSSYETVVNNNNRLTNDVESLNSTILDLTSKVSNLEIISESLRITADNEILKASTFEIQNTITNLKVSETTIDLSNSVQNSINEAIQRVSLTARNESLLQENTSLREQLFGLASQTAEGAITGTSNGFTVKVNNGSNGDSSQLQSDLYAKASAKKIKNGENAEMTNTIEVNNVTTDNKITKVMFINGGDGKQWFTVVDGDAGKSIEPESGIVFNVIFNTANGGELKGMKPKKRENWIGYSGSATNYKDRTLKVEVTFADGTTDSVTLTTDLRKNKK